MVYYDDVKFETPVSTLHVGPSLVPFTNNNPGYRLTTIDSNTFEILDYDMYYVDLPASNLKNELVIDKLFSAKSTFGLPDLTPQSWHDLAIRFQHDDPLFQKYYQFTNRLAKNQTCDNICKRKALCKIHTSRADDPEMCDRFVPNPLPNGITENQPSFVTKLIVAVVMLLNSVFF